MLEVKNWLHEVNGLYLTLIPCFIWLNNFVGPKALEPVFTRDYLIAQFDKIAESSSTSSATSKSAFVPSAGKAPMLPKNMFARAANPRVKAFSLATAGLFALAKPVSGNRK